MARLGVGVVAALLLAVACCLLISTPAPAEAYSGGGSGLGYNMLTTTAHLASPCDGALGQCSAMGDEDDGDQEDGGDGLLRRALAARKPTNKYVSYAALNSNQVPCNKRGQSYYQNCASQQPANPYRRGCSAITRCSRNMN